MAITQVFVDTQQWAAYMQRLTDSFQPTVLRGVRLGAQRCVPIMQRRTEQAPAASPRGTPGAFDKGDYKRAWKTAELPNGASVFNQAPYSPVVETGRRMSPVGKQGRLNLERWARQKLKMSPDEARNASFAIAAALAGKGTKAHPLKGRNVMGGGIAEMVKAVLDEVKHELEVELAKKP